MRTSGSTLHTAIGLALHAHKDQLDKAGKLYILHPLQVMLNALDAGYDNAIATIAVLHDVVEDTRFTLDDLRNNGYSDRVVAGVDSVTRRPEETYRDFIRRCMQNADGVKVKALDVAHNKSRLGNLDSEAAEGLESRYNMAEFMIRVGCCRNANGNRLYIHSAETEHEFFIRTQGFCIWCYKEDN